MMKEGEGVELGIDHQHHVAAGAAVAAIRAAAGDVLLAMEVHHAIAALAGRHGEVHLIQEHRCASCCLLQVFVIKSISL